jgi:hypothetical protein
MKAMIAGLSLLLLSGCATDGQAPWNALTQSASCSKLGSDEQLKLNLADDMANDGKLHASLANLQSLPDNVADVRLRRANFTAASSAPASPPLPNTASASSRQPGATTARPRPTCNAPPDWRQPMKKSATTSAWSTSTNGASTMHASNS